ncbi:MAG: hypothetical protein Q9170_002858, partial [Blastenia crenularia]
MSSASPPMATNGDRAQLELFRRKYLQMVDPHEIEFPDGDIIMPREAQEWLCDRVFSKDRYAYLPTARYTYRILKKLILDLEAWMNNSDKDEIIDELMDLFNELLSGSEQDEMVALLEKCYVTYTAPVQGEEAQAVTILEAPHLLSSGGDSGNRTWAAALFLGTYLFTDGRHYVEQKSVLELGAGLGFLSILCAKHLGAKDLSMTDGSKAVVDLARRNVEMNSVENIVEASVLEWGKHNVHNVLQQEAEMIWYDLVIGADILYDPRDFPALVSTLRDLFKHLPELQVLLASAIRTESTLTSFLDACDANNFQVKDLDIPAIPSEKQSGFFHPTFDPIHIYLIKSFPPEEIPSQKDEASYAAGSSQPKGRSSEEEPSPAASVEISSKAGDWYVRNFHAIRGSLDRREARHDIYPSMAKDATPELINVINRTGSWEALWRVPYVPGRDQWMADLTAAVAHTMCELAHRWEPFAIGLDDRAGDIFLMGPLAAEECLDILHGRFPPTLRPYGIPGPGVCTGSSRPPASGQYPPAGPKHIFANPPQPVRDPCDRSQANYIAHSPHHSGPRIPTQSQQHGSRRPQPGPHRFIASLSDDESSSSDTEEEDPAQKKRKGKGKKGKGGRRQRSPSDDDEDEERPSRG